MHQSFLNFGVRQGPSAAALCSTAERCRCSRQLSPAHRNGPTTHLQSAPARTPSLVRAPWHGISRAAGRIQQILRQICLSKAFNGTNRCVLAPTAFSLHQKLCLGTESCVLASSYNSFVLSAGRGRGAASRGCGAPGRTRAARAARVISGRPRSGASVRASRRAGFYRRAGGDCRRPGICGGLRGDRGGG